jgi:putative hydrolase of the HAD superfamily
VLKELSEAGYQLGIISNTDSLNYVMIRLVNNKIYKYFNPDCIYLSCMSMTRKPNKGIFIEACKDLNVLPSETIYVGDTISRDVIGAKNANLCACIRINSKSFLEKKEATTLIGQDTKYIIDSLSEIPGIIKKISKTF